MTSHRPWTQEALLKRLTNTCILWGDWSGPALVLPCRLLFKSMCVGESSSSFAITVQYAHWSGIKSAEKEASFLQRTFTPAGAETEQRTLWDPIVPAHKMFSFLLSGRRLRSPTAPTTRFKSSFYTEAVRLMNSGFYVSSTSYCWNWYYDGVYDALAWFRSYLTERTFCISLEIF